MSSYFYGGQAAGFDGFYAYGAPLPEDGAAGGGLLFGRSPFPRSRYVVRRGHELLVFDSKAKAEAVQRAVDEAKAAAQSAIDAAKQTSNRAARRAKSIARQASDESLLPLLRDAPPVESVDLREAQQLAHAYRQHQAMAEALRQRDYEAALRMWQELRDEEDDIAALMELM